MSARRPKPAPTPRTHEPAIETLIAVTQELLEMDRKSGDGVAFNPWDREGLHKRVEAAIAAVRAPVVTESKLRTVADGRKLAMKMIREFRGSRADACCCESRYRPGKPQQNVLGRYLQTLRESGPDVTAGFCTIMNDQLSSSRGGLVNVELYERLERRRGYNRGSARGAPS